ncbi:MAG: Holliday junction branch migration DNA helicase RuvB [Verrucomicrobiota bacterium]
MNSSEESEFVVNNPVPDVLERSLRPKSLEDFVGQQKSKERLGVMVQSAIKRGDTLDHVLLSGPPGLGKTTLAHILAHSMGVGIKITSGPALEKAGDLAGLLTSLEKGDILFIDEIHRMNKNIEEYLYPAMEDYRLDIIIDQGPNARSVTLNLPAFTLVGATTRPGMLSAPLRSRFGINNRLEYYDSSELEKIVIRSGTLLDLDMEDQAASVVALRSRGTPRIANNLLRWVRDYTTVKTDGKVTDSVARDALEMLEIDQWGLNEMDKRLLRSLVEKFKGGPVGLNSLATAVAEDPNTIEEVHEPFLIMEGYLQRTQQGRIALPLTYERLGLKPSGDSQNQLL